MVFPTVMLAFLLLMQWAVKMQAERVADAAAHEGAAAAAAWDGDAGTGRQVAGDYLTRLGSQVTQRSVAATRNATEATVTVRGTVLQLLPGMELRISRTATAPVERFVTTPREFTNSEGSSGGN